MRNLITGGAGFIGSHLVDSLMKAGEYVICLDNFYTGNFKNIQNWENHPNFLLIEHDVALPIQLDIDRIWHFACPGSPFQYQRNPIKTSKTNFLGTYNMLDLAKRSKAKILLASTSEVYGDPEINPQKEDYRGSVNPIGVRSCYDEGKRMSESLCFDYLRTYKVDISIARIFNTYGPRMVPNDGRVISNFICQALSHRPLTIYGDGSQIRSFCYIDDLINGLVSLMDLNFPGPVNLGNSTEYSILEISKLIINQIGFNNKLINMPLPDDDPRRRNPDISLAKEKLKWEPKIDISLGLAKTISYFKKII